MSDATTLLEERAGPVAILTLNVPARRNALSAALRQRLADRLRAIETDPEVRSIVLTGAGGTFCSGGDLTDMQVTDLAGARARMEATHQLVRALVKSAKPIVAAVEGWAAGAGLSVALGCDLVVASAEARFVASFGNVGLIGDLGLLHTLPRRVGDAWARRILLLGETVDAATAERIGIAHAVVASGTARETALGFAARLAERAPLAIAMTKALLADGLDALLDREREQQAVLFQTADHAEGKAAFLAKRPPRFVGR
jgi:enoyl-CoA hydratase/carnithine racemase